MLAPDINTVTFENARHTLMPYLEYVGRDDTRMVPWYVNLEAYIKENGGCRDIYRNENGNPVLYLQRHYIYRDHNREIMLHRFFLGDKGPLHDHPASSWGTILQTGYN